MPGAAQHFPRYRYTPDGTRIDNITDWGTDPVRIALRQEARRARNCRRMRYSPMSMASCMIRSIARPMRRTSSADFPRIPFQKDFWLWADWGRRLLDLHIGYEEQDPWLVKRSDLPDEKARAAGMAPQTHSQGRARGRRDPHRFRDDAFRHPARGFRLQARATARASPGSSTSTRKRPRATPPSARSSTPTASPITRNTSST